MIAFIIGFLVLALFIGPVPAILIILAACVVGAVLGIGLGAHDMVRYGPDEALRRAESRGKRS